MIKIGFANQYFTLWEVTVTPQYTQYGNFTVHTHDMVYNDYIKNISIREDKVRKLYPDFDSIFDENLRGKSRSFESTQECGDWWGAGYGAVRVFDHGKFIDMSIEEVFEKEPEYLIWYRDQFDPFNSKYRQAVKKNIQLFEPLQAWEEKRREELEEALWEAFTMTEEGEQVVTAHMDTNPVEYSDDECYLDYTWFARMSSTLTSDGQPVNYQDKEQLRHVRIFNVTQEQVKFRSYYKGRELWSLLFGDKGKLTKGRDVTLRVKKTEEHIEERKVVEIFTVIEVVSIEKKK